MRWFGVDWSDPPQCDPADRVRTPIGSRCAHCERSIRPWSRGLLVPVEGLTVELPYHHHCWLISRGQAKAHDDEQCCLVAGHSGECQVWGWRLGRPAIRVSVGNLVPRDDPDRDWYQCPACKHGFLGVERRLPSFRLRRESYCMRCGQRFYFTDALLRGEPFETVDVQ